MGSLLAGRPVAQEINNVTRNEIIKIKSKAGVNPAMVIISADPDCPMKQFEVKLHADLAEQLGIAVRVVQLDKNIDENTLLDKIEQFNNDENVYGIFTLLPLPDHINPELILSAISSKKELEGLCETKTIDNLFKGKQISVLSAVLLLLKNVNYDIFKGKNIFLVEDDILETNPVVLRLLSIASGLNIQIEIVTTNNKNYLELSSQADLLLVSLDKPESIDQKFIKKNAIVIDFNSTVVGEVYSDEKARLVPVLKSSLKIDSVLEKASYVDPASGGVGPVALAVLMQNFLHNVKNSLGMKS